MSNTNEIELIKYSGKVEKANCITHAIGAILTVFCLIIAIKATNDKSIYYRLSGILHSVALMSVYSISALYHGLKPGKAKLIFRRLDHVAIPILQAATATPCALITLRKTSEACCWICFIVGWLCAIYGATVKLFFFSKLKSFTMAVYFISGFIMLGCAFPCINNINRQAFTLLIVGCLLYIVGAIFCRLGMKRPYFHPIFHIFVLSASLIHFYIIYAYIYTV